MQRKRLVKEDSDLKDDNFLTPNLYLNDVREKIVEIRGFLLNSNFTPTIKLIK